MKESGSVSRSELELFAEEVGPEGPVCIVGGRTHWEVGGLPDPSAREVRAPSGIVQVLPDEMMVRVRAGTPLRELIIALEEKGQMIPVDVDQQGSPTIGGALSVGWSSIRRLRWGPIRDLVLEIRYVNAAGKLIKGGAPVVKNVSGFDLPKVFVGSLGTLGCLAEVVLRTQPRPRVAKWIVTEGNPFEIRKQLFRPSSILWDGIKTWVLLEGSGREVQAELACLREHFEEVDAPPHLPKGKRVSLRPSAIKQYATSLAPSSYVAEIGVGLVHLDSNVQSTPPGMALSPLPPGSIVDPALQDGGSDTMRTTSTAEPTLGASLPTPTLAVHKRLKDFFDPMGRLNPGRSLL
ncbi:MAG: FAD-binding protein [Actinobacteria bacterium]|nr:FAD-binding protein [Actinomycetota bacterium]